MHRNVRLTLALVVNFFLTGLGLLFYRRYLFAILYFIPFVVAHRFFAPELCSLQFSLLVRGLILIASYVHIIILHRRFLRDRLAGEIQLPTQTSSCVRRDLAMSLKILIGFGSVAWLIGDIMMGAWYIEWLDTYFLWRFLALSLGFLTALLIPLAVMIEWLWHGWPAHITWGFIWVCVWNGPLCAGLFRTNFPA